jgi:quinol monooxygenase YgiN
VLSVTHFVAPEPGFEARVRAVLGLLSERPGYLRGTLARSADDPSAWVLVSEWRDVGSYRRALGSYDIKLAATPVLASAQDLPSSFEPLVEVAPGGAVTTHTSDRSPQSVPSHPTSESSTDDLVERA